MKFTAKYANQKPDFKSKTIDKAFCYRFCKRVKQGLILPIESNSIIKILNFDFSKRTFIFNLQRYKDSNLVNHKV